MSVGDPREMAGDRDRDGVGASVGASDTGSGNPVPAGTIGTVEVKGPNLFSGYWQMPEKTAEEMRPDGFFITGDLGVFS